MSDDETDEEEYELWSGTSGINRFVRNDDVDGFHAVIRRNPNLNLNLPDPYNDCPILEYAIYNDYNNIAKFLINHPGIDVNRYHGYGGLTSDDGNDCPLDSAMCGGNFEIFFTLLKDKRVTLWSDGISSYSTIIRSPMSECFYMNDIKMMKALIAIRGNENLSCNAEPSQWSDWVNGNNPTTIPREECYRLISEYKQNKKIAMFRCQKELGFKQALSSCFYSCVVFLCDGLLRVKRDLIPEELKVARFLEIASRLPIELQMILCNRVHGLANDSILCKDSEYAFKDLASLV